MVPLGPGYALVTYMDADNYSADQSPIPSSV